MVWNLVWMHTAVDKSSSFSNFFDFSAYDGETPPKCLDHRSPWIVLSLENKLPLRQGNVATVSCDKNVEQRYAPKTKNTCNMGRDMYDHMYLCTPPSTKFKSMLAPSCLQYESSKNCSLPFDCVLWTMYSKFDSEGLWLIHFAQNWQYIQ